MEYGFLSSRTPVRHKALLDTFGINKPLTRNEQLGSKLEKMARKSILKAKNDDIEEAELAALVARRCSDTLSEVWESISVIQMETGWETLDDFFDGLNLVIQHYQGKKPVARREAC